MLYGAILVYLTIIANVLLIHKFVGDFMYRHLKAQGLYSQHFNLLVTYVWAQKARVLDFNGPHRLHRNKPCSLLAHSKVQKLFLCENDF
jgi:hypothetical protein